MTIHSKGNALKLLKWTLGAVIILLIVGLLIPEKLVIPVQGATSKDWNHNTFWYEPWGRSGVHKGIDIFGAKNTPVVAATSGIVIFSGELNRGGKVVAVLGAKWRVHYFAHLNDYHVSAGDVVSINSQIGLLGDTGNAAGKQPHVHYSILSLMPMPWLFTTQSQGWKKMFFLNPHKKLTAN
ncbi:MULTISPECIES: M23 family metallopeptidase [unclassified Pseudoalteromonas]|jgi:murein DD-endopeptidase MepM/ murein hydrolase activator NlpD|uniref:M23 family metallopeptidase n=1 Tax=unclassified Pseudoalteromonas TaxID=194690 RepID=UPI0020C00137|nr:MULTISPECIES: M23 family metallopeptidase [unclassified Pseudoalteromonas]MCK8106331.1 M23 family metallopeptidase [Pseudoalteromonas sp. 2CM41L]MDC9501431.1 M23 family metallopeptidase [Pseudoalteromonas sp. Angola-18]MDC9528204.1 M23 family metallopeptidase [Pseudoalteromonas sp. Angola-7]